MPPAALTNNQSICLRCQNAHTLVPLTRFKMPSIFHPVKMPRTEDVYSMANFGVVAICLLVVSLSPPLSAVRQMAVLAEVSGDVHGAPSVS